MNTILPRQTREEYDAMKAFNASLLKVATKKTAKHAWLQCLDPDRERKETAALRLGILTHMALLEPVEFLKVATSEHGSRTKAYREEKEKAEAAGLYFASLQEVADASSYAQAIRRHPVLGTLFPENSENDWQNELTISWAHRSGYACKSRVDAIRYFDGTLRIHDVKTAIDGSEEGVGLAAYNGDWLLQGAFYFDAVRSALPSIEVELGFAEGFLRNVPLVFEFDVVEKLDGYPMVARYTLTEEQIDLGRMLYEVGLKKVVDSTETDYWAGYDVGTKELVLPYWAERNWAKLIEGAQES